MKSIRKTEYVGRDEDLVSLYTHACVCLYVCTYDYWQNEVKRIIKLIVRFHNHMRSQMMRSSIWNQTAIICRILFKEVKWNEVTQSCPTLCNPRDCSLPCFSVYGIFQARVLEWGAMSFSRGSSQPREWTRASRIVGRSFTLWATREALLFKGRLW